NDYDCDYGKASIPADVFNGDLDFVKTPGGYNEQNDNLLIGHSNNNLCVKYDTAGSSDGSDNSFVAKCESQRCLVTGKNVSTEDNGGGASLQYEACCVYGDSSLHSS
ncbi:hypothetical protein ACHAXR_004712, partial [Thalassiosira sp. AJA248-18]